MRLIDADTLKAELIIQDYIYAANWIVDAAPTIDAVLVKHGQWIVLDECANAGAYCSVCHKKVYKECYGNCKMKSTYCPNCGAKMDEADDNDNN